MGSTNDKRDNNGKGKQDDAQQRNALVPVKRLFEPTSEQQAAAEKRQASARTDRKLDNTHRRRCWPSNQNGKQCYGVNQDQQRSQDTSTER